MEALILASPTVFVKTAMEALTEEKQGRRYSRNLNEESV
jgi:hypothetical protein